MKNIKVVVVSNRRSETEEAKWRPLFRRNDVESRVWTPPKFHGSSLAGVDLVVMQMLGNAAYSIKSKCIDAKIPCVRGEGTHGFNHVRGLLNSLRLVRNSKKEGATVSNLVNELQSSAETTIQSARDVLGPVLEPASVTQPEPVDVVGEPVEAPAVGAVMMVPRPVAPRRRTREGALRGRRAPGCQAGRWHLGGAQADVREHRC